TPAAPEVVGEDGGVGTARAQAAQAQGASDTQTRDPAVVAGGDDPQPAQAPGAAAGPPLDQQPADAATDAPESADARRIGAQGQPDQEAGQAQRLDGPRAGLDGRRPTHPPLPGR